MNNLKKYNEKRNFNKTNEPTGIVSKKKNTKLKYIIQHHIARKDHYDLRLEYKGVFISFAVPKGPSFSPKDKRLAIKVEDHPLSYGNFEGTIPKGEYGAGTVMLFDKGFWEPTSKVDFEKGPIKFTINGKRLKGAWSLIKYKENNWLLIKEKDKYINSNNIKNYTTSIKTDRTMEEIAQNTQKINLTSPDKIIFEKEKITKKDIFNYYNLVKDKMMPYLENRLISTIRCPNKISESFFMKHLNTNSKNIGKKKIKNENYYYIKNENGILEEVQMNSYEFHIWGSSTNNIKKPNILVFDLDPDEKLPIKKVREGVKNLKKILDNLKLKSYLKTSGGKGYHIYIPLKTTSWKKLDKIAKNIANLLIETYPNKYTTNMRKDMRKNKIFIDYFRNREGATSCCPYSLRLKKNAPISCPIYWKELDTIKPNSITIKNIKERLKKRDPWKDFFNT